MDGKVCKYCDDWKPFDEFQKDKGMKDGHKNYCKACYKTKVYSYGDKKGTEKRKPSTYEKKGYSGNGLTPHLISARIIEGVEVNGKVCKTCEDWKPVTEYHKFERTHDGLELYCKSCRKEALSAYFKTESGKENAYKARGKRRSRINGVKFSAHFKKQVFERDKWICQHCGIKVHDGDWKTPDKAHADHKISLFDGGDTVLDNMQTLCRTCNLSKGKKSEGDYQLSLDFADNI